MENIIETLITSTEEEHSKEVKIDTLSFLTSIPSFEKEKEKWRKSSEKLLETMF